jgi:oligoribonuclease NrnB/cAMP/cGMP phosphodiesterase (DHH superfamily)
MIEINNNKIVVLHHHDLDGLASASLVLRALKNPNITFIPQDPNEPFPDLFVYEVYILDVAVTQKNFESLKNIHASKLVWIDHHKPFQELSALHFPGNVQIIVDPQSPSAVMLVQKYFALNDEISKKIVELGTKADTWQIDSLVSDWMNLDMAFSFKRRLKTPLIEALAEGKLEISGRLKRTLDSYVRHKELAKKKLLQNTIVREIHGHSVAVGLAPSILSGSESADLILKETNAEIQIVLKYQGWMSFRRAKDSTVNLITLAQLWGGGGHEYASGATYPKHVTSRNFTKVAEEIFSKIAEVL